MRENPDWAIHPNVILLNLQDYCWQRRVGVFAPTSGLSQKLPDPPRGVKDYFCF
jgi:hypothetical protein